MLGKVGLCCVVLAAGVLATPADIIVSFNPADATIPTVHGSVDVQIVASIPQSDSIIGWGLDLIVDTPGLVSWSVLSLGPDFVPFSAPDGDGLGGIVPTPPGTSVWGASVLLATLRFTGVADYGQTSICTGSTPGDLTEGFARDPDIGGFANALYTCGMITLVPEPASLLLVSLAGLAVVRRRSRTWRNT
jgi:hypothetical protein